jgi:hypothetical protein
MYKIVITEIVSQEKMERGEWVVIEKRPLTKAEFNDSNTSYQERKDADQMKSIFGYAPDHLVTRTSERQIYTQEVAELDLVAVISAVNQMNVVVKGDKL